MATTKPTPQSSLDKDKPASQLTNKPTEKEITLSTSKVVEETKVKKSSSNGSSSIRQITSLVNVVLVGVFSLVALILFLGQAREKSAEKLQAEQAFIAYLLNDESLNGLTGDPLNQEQRDRLCFAIAHGLIEAPKVYYGFSDDGDSFDKLFSEADASSDNKARDYFNNTRCSARIPSMPSNFRAFQ